jgi:hypothetical protein|tara:strand:+ start:63022 stop:63423 length:402 start_codon:yes stop_codon:yes gene_type:complete
MKGNCLCGKVNYEVEGEIGNAVRCYCRSCQQVTGSAFASVALTTVCKFRIISGHEAISSFESSPGKHRRFCSGCGSAVYTKTETDPDVIRIRLGGIEDPVGVNFKHHIFVSEKVDWYEIVDDLPQFDAWPTML